MGSKPSSWGTGKKAAPPSITQDDKVPSPRADVIEGEGTLFDNTSATGAVTASTGLPTEKSAKAVQYTLTSSERAKAPKGWGLRGSSDGSTWRDLDKRSGESFAWDKQTRAFSVATPGMYRHYRLILDGEGTLAEGELLA